jgi:AcrR family transcriptional regulator
MVSLPKRSESSSLDLRALTSGGRDRTERHREVLREAMQLIAERGYRGASLRELARRVGMQQPSLYHYFRSKNELVEQILETFGVGGAANLPDALTAPEHLEEIPGMIAGLVGFMYDHTDWPIFVRFLFNLSLEAPEYAPKLRSMFTDTTEQLFRAAAEPYVAKGLITADDCVHLCRMVVNAVGLCFIEERLLFPREEKNPWMEQYIAFVVRFTTEGIAAGRLVPTPAATLAVPAPASKAVATPKTGRRTPAHGRPKAR